MGIRLGDRARLPLLGDPAVASLGERVLRASWGLRRGAGAGWRTAGGVVVVGYLFLRLCKQAGKRKATVVGGGRWMVAATKTRAWFERADALLERWGSDNKIANGEYVFCFFSLRRGREKKRGKRRAGAGGAGAG